MRALAPWLLWLAVLAGSPAIAAEIGVATLVEGQVRLLRGTTWHKTVPGTGLEDGDILAVGEKSLVQLEVEPASAVSLTGPGAVHIEPPPAKSRAGAPAATVFNVQDGWLKVAAAAPGVRVRTAPADVAIIDGVMVMRAKGPALELFMESGSARLTETAAAGADATPRDLRSGEYWSKLPGAAFAMAARPPKAFVDAMPRHHVDALPRLRDRFKTRPTLVPEGEITYAEAEPWLTGRDRVAFERRFVSRLRDRAFRNAVAPHAARYPAWDRRLNPHKYAPPPAPRAAAPR